jgi:hypothetical protein
VTVRRVLAAFACLAAMTGSIAAVGAAGRSQARARWPAADARSSVRPARLLAAIGTYGTGQPAPGGQAAPRGLTWSRPAAVDPAHSGGVSSVSRPARSAPALLCAGVDQGGSALTYSGTTWSGPVTISPTGVMAGVPCAGPSFCAALADSGDSGGGPDLQRRRLEPASRVLAGSSAIRGCTSAGVCAAQAATLPGRRDHAPFAPFDPGGRNAAKGLVTTSVRAANR